jgi:hypothetical protein
MTGGDTAQDLVGGFYDDFNGGDIGEAVSAFAEDLETIDPGIGLFTGSSRSGSLSIPSSGQCRLDRRLSAAGDRPSPRSDDPRLYVSIISTR